jgi:hypothetical protein
LVWQTPLNTIGGFAAAGLEAALLKRGVDQLTIRKRWASLSVTGQTEIYTAPAARKLEHRCLQNLVCGCGRPSTLNYAPVISVIIAEVTGSQEERTKLLP